MPFWRWPVAPVRVFNVLAKDLSLANRLIAMLPAPQRGELLACCTLVELRRHEQLIGAGQLLEYAYFPVDSFVSLVMHVPGSAGIQLALVGNEGMLPASPVLRATASPFTCKVQGPGRALRLRRHALQFAVFDASGVRDLLDRMPETAIPDDAKVDWPALGHPPINEHFAGKKPIPDFPIHDVKH